ncbi:ABC transporter permease [Novispirillum itersonii]|uniref:Ribose transport system permease protein n=1 Tax=Novispirillum itersonii TaxID=189 RepID=A0A7W9ZFX9_NOVIT|nr:ABC transporter permease [Novispirillum itersonii]MBB6209319.1 ribose transport system permease protein [Novispirillum itersonii]
MSDPISLRGMIPHLALPLALAVMLTGFSAVEPRSLSAGNLLNVLEQSSYLIVFTLAQTVVLLTRGFDLSVGMAASAVSVAAALAAVSAGPAAGLAVALLLAGAVGLLNGTVVALLRVNPFVATLGMLNICLGLASTLSGGRPVTGVPEGLTTLFYSGTVLGIPAPVLIAALCSLGLALLLHRTVFGRSLYLTGGNPRAAEVAGVRVRATLIGAYTLCALLAGLGAVMLTARTGSGEPSLGGSLTLESIAAAVIGGVSLRGGSGGVTGAVLGAVFVTALSNGMNLTRVDGNVQMIVLGVVVVAAVALDRFRDSR